MNHVPAKIITQRRLEVLVGESHSPLMFTPSPAVAVTGSIPSKHTADAGAGPNE
jgi:hypothetical protein